MQEGKQNIWNAPNILTMLRLLLIPIYWVLMMVRNNETAALIVFVTASITDLLDGYIARHFNQVTDWGKLFDPLADKLMVVSVMMTLVLKGAVPLIILIIIGIKDLDKFQQRFIYMWRSQKKIKCIIMIEKHMKVVFLF